MLDGFEDLQRCAEALRGELNSPEGTIANLDAIMRCLAAELETVLPGFRQAIAARRQLPQEQLNVLRSLEWLGRSAQAFAFAQAMAPTLEEATRLSQAPFAELRKVALKVHSTCYDNLTFALEEFLALC